MVDRALELFHRTGIRYPAPDVLESLARLDADAGEPERAGDTAFEAARDRGRRLPLERLVA